MLNHLSMRIQLLPVASLLWTAYGHIVSPATGLSFDGAGAVSLFWGLDNDATSSYDFYLCAGDETTDKYVCSSFSFDTPANHA